MSFILYSLPIRNGEKREEESFFFSFLPDLILNTQANIHEPIIFALSLVQYVMYFQEGNELCTK